MLTKRYHSRRLTCLRLATDYLILWSQIGPIHNTYNLNICRQIASHQIVLCCAKRQRTFIYLDTEVITFISRVQGRGVTIRSCLDALLIVLITDIFKGGLDCVRDLEETVATKFLNSPLFSSLICLFTCNCYRQLRVHN